MRYFLMNAKYEWLEVPKETYHVPSSFNVTCETCGEELVQASDHLRDHWFHSRSIPGVPSHPPVPKTHWINNRACIDSEGMVTIAIANVDLQQFSELIDLLQESWR